MKLNTKFQSVFYINLDRRPDRNEHCLSQLERAGITATRETAIDAKIVGISGKEACTLSHLNCLKQGERNVFIFEDDVVISKFYHEVEQVLEDLPSDWDLFYLGANHRTDPIYVKGNLYQAVEPYCNHAWGVSESYLSKLIEEVEKRKDIVIDVITADLVTSGKAKAYCAYPSLAHQLPNLSDIEGRFMDYSFIIPDREF